MWDDRIINCFCLVMVVLVGVMFFFKLTQPSNDDLIKDGKYWSADCILKEVDLPTGFLTGNINRLDCSGVVVNVVKGKYDQAVSAYNKSKNQR